MFSAVLDTLKGPFKNDVTAKMRFFDPPSSHVTIFGLPPPSPVTGANGHKLLPING